MMIDRKKWAAVAAKIVVMVLVFNALQVIALGAVGQMNIAYGWTGAQVLQAMFMAGCFVVMLTGPIAGLFWRLAGRAWQMARDEARWWEAVDCAERRHFADRVVMVSTPKDTDSPIEKAFLDARNAQFRRDGWRFMAANEGQGYGSGVVDLDAEGHGHRPHQAGATTPPGV